MYENIIIWTILTLVPLIPTIVTHKFLESSATYKNTHQGVKLGGAIAAYFILVTTAFLTYNNMFSDPLTSIRHSLSGNWACTGRIIESNNEASVDKSFNSTLNIRVNGGGRISLTGEVKAINAFWQAEEVIVTPRKLIYIYQMPLNDATGIAWLTFSRDNDDGDIGALFGNWVVTGSKGKGTISCFREFPE